MTISRSCQRVRSFLIIDRSCIVVITRQFFLEPAHLLRNLVESELQHHTLGDDKNHVGGDKNFTLDCCVHPLPAAGSAAYKLAVVDENAAPELDRDVTEGKEA